MKIYEVYKRLKQGSYGRIIEVKGEEEDVRYFIPTTKEFCNARVLEHTDKDLFIHWQLNYNTTGDFKTELMRFDPTYQIRERCYIGDNQHDTRNRKLRKELGLIY